MLHELPISLVKESEESIDRVMSVYKQANNPCNELMLIYKASIIHNMTIKSTKLNKSKKTASIIIGQISEHLVKFNILVADHLEYIANKNEVVL